MTKASLFAGVEQMRPGNHLGDVSAAIQRAVEAEGLSIIRTLVGHGIGREMHEEPQVPNFGEPGKGPELEEGMVLAIEPMVNVGGPLVRMGDDGWSVYSEDGSLAAHFEFTVAVTADGPRILTPWHEEPSSQLGRPGVVCSLRWGRRNSEGEVLDSFAAALGVALALLIALLALAAAAPAAPAAVLSPTGPTTRAASATSCRPGENGARHASAQILAFRGPGTAAAALRRPAAALRKPRSTARPTLTDARSRSYFKDATFGVAAGRSRIDDRTATRGDDRARQRLRRPAHLRRHPRRHDVRRRLRGRRTTASS